jgi:hypothetical protein
MDQVQSGIALPSRQRVMKVWEGDTSIAAAEMEPFEEAPGFIRAHSKKIFMYFFLPVLKSKESMCVSLKSIN